MPKNKCGKCHHYEECSYLDARMCRMPILSGYRADPIFLRFIPKTYIAEKEWLNQWEEKDGNI